MKSQGGSKLMQLPQEVRDHIYGCLFRSTRFCHGRRAIGRIDLRRVVSVHRGTALAILRTCRRISKEVGDTWLGQALFHFEEPEAMLDKLADLPLEKLAQIRYVRVSGAPLLLPLGDHDVFYRLTHVLKLLPGLQLDVLTVLGPRDPIVSYETVTTLIEYSDGWRELRFLSHSPDFLAYEYESDFWAFEVDYQSPDDRCARMPQPASWQQMLEQRDGACSSPFVVVYLAKDPSIPGAVLQHDKRDPYRQMLQTDLPADEAMKAFSETRDMFLARCDNSDKEMLVVAVRGNGVDYAEKEGSPHIDALGDIRVDHDNKTWVQIKECISERERMWRGSDSDGDSDSGRLDASTLDEDRRIILDEYTDVDQYTWPPLHSHKDELRNEVIEWQAMEVEV